MKDVLIRLCRFLLSLLGICAWSCDYIGSSDLPSEEYGVPHADFEIKGKVTDAGLNQPIKGIRVSVSDESVYVPVYTETDDEGRFVLSGEFFPKGNIGITAEDVDGEENRGSFAAQTVSVQLEQTGNGDGWYSGMFSAENVSISLYESLDDEDW